MMETIATQRPEAVPRRAFRAPAISAILFDKEE